MKTFLTTTLPYANSTPHIGHAFEFILGDALTRALRQFDDQEVSFNLGLDEHGTKVFKTAESLGLSPQDYVDKLAEDWDGFCEKFHINYFSFYRTSSADHHRKVRAVWSILFEKGLIYKKAYSGTYCTGCEAYKTGKDLVNGRCPDHPTLALEETTEENYFFELTRFKQSLLDWQNAQPEFLVPGSKYQELINLIEGIEDISISREKKTCPWGIAVPDDENQVIYVWFDALLNYIIAAGYPDRLEWESPIQICGPDNLRFQAVIFQAFLCALDIPYSNRLLVHGTILDEHGHKQSKTTGNVIDPLDQLEKFGLDAVRYYALAGLNTYDNSGWSEKLLVQTFNTQICNDWGNLVSRVLHLLDTKCQGEATSIAKDFGWELAKQVSDIEKLWLAYQPKEALTATNQLVQWANRYIDTEKPWSAEATNPTRAISNLYHALEIINELYAPVLTVGFEKTKEALASKKKAIVFQKLKTTTP